MTGKFPEWIITNHHTGSQYPYYLEEQTGEKQFDFNIDNIINKIPVDKRALELTSIIEILHKGYIYGDKTLIKGIKRAPWLAELNKNGDWEYSKIIKHGNNITDDVASHVKKLLHEELLGYIGSYKRVGILLSGGLDSRIIAGILKEAQINKDFKGEVIVYNWGMAESRDVIYAKEIAKLYNWDFINFPITPDTLRENFYNSLMVGAEISPIHLHRMIKVRDDLNSEIVIAGTYGDSLGRGMYSGTHVTSLKNLMNDNLNNFGIFKEQFIKDYKLKVKENYYQYKDQLIDDKQPIELREVEQNIHYLRRLLATAMSIIAQKKPIYQMFTSPAIVGYIWGLHRAIRNDDIYKEILKTLPKGIGNIPYAKTGKSFIDFNSREVDNYSSNYHQYGKWLRNDLKSFIEKELDLHLLEELNIFNMTSLEKIYKIWSKTNTNSINQVDNIISTLTSYSMFINKYDMNYGERYRVNLKDRFNAVGKVLKIKGYQLIREQIRK